MVGVVRPRQKLAGKDAPARGQLKFSVCSPARCQTEEVDVDTGAPRS
ncbi:MAG: hypothetical protein OEZ06_16090 [Myxococcales bacterium]|nr:hypothetical protein [Myxococcales bacterium]